MSKKYRFHNPNGLYFVSFATVNWVDVFTRTIYKEIFIDSIKYCQKNKGLELYCWCLMTNHVHMIISAQDGFLLSDIMRDMKKFTSKKIVASILDNPQESRKGWLMAMFEREGEYNRNNLTYQFWQQGNHPIELWSNKIIDTKTNYIHNNPVVTGVVDNPEEYVYSSARDYAGIKGKLSVVLL